MAVLGSIRDIEPLHREDVGRYVLAVFVTIAVHALLLQIFVRPHSPYQASLRPYLAVTLINLPPKPQSPDLIDTPPVEPELAEPAPNITPRVKPAAPKTADITPELSTAPSAIKAPNILTSQEPITSSGDTNTVPLPDSAATPVPPTPSASEARIDTGLKALATDLGCLNGFDTDCAELRKDVFKELQLSETDKVWTKKYAHTGLPVEFYGLSERQIRKKLNLKFAGENGIYIPFTNIGIDGAWWDSLHGVKKSCEWKIAIDPNGRHGAIKDCPNYLPAAKEDRDRRNKPIPTNRWTIP